MCRLFKNKPSNFGYSEGKPCEESSIVDLTGKKLIENNGLFVFV